MFAFAFRTPRQRFSAFSLENFPCRSASSHRPPAAPKSLIFFFCRCLRVKVAFASSFNRAMRFFVDLVLFNTTNNSHAQTRRTFLRQENSYDICGSNDGRSRSTWLCDIDSHLARRKETSRWSTTANAKSHRYFCDFGSEKRNNNNKNHTSTYAGKLSDANAMHTFKMIAEDVETNVLDDFNCCTTSLCLPCTKQNVNDYISY